MKTPTVLAYPNSISAIRSCLARVRANGRIGGGRYKLSATQQAEAIKMIRVGEKSQAEIAELFNVDKSTISRMMKEVREKELLKAAR